MSNPSFRDQAQPEPMTPARLADPLQRKAAPLAAWFMLTAVMAAHCAVLATALAGRSGETDLPEFLGVVIAGGIFGAVLGGLTGLFDQSPLRGGILGSA